MTPVAPDYDGGSLANVLASAAAALNVPGYWDVLEIGEGYRHVVVMLIDGLGLSALRAHSDVSPFLNSADVRGISASAPTTTPTGLASLGTGQPPGSHGVVGASFRVEGHHGLLHPLNWQDSPIPRAVQPEPTLLERLTAQDVHVTSVGPRAYADSGLTAAALRGGRYVGADSVGERCADVKTALDHDGAGLTYVYWPDLDRTGHGHGIDSDHWRAELHHVDYLVERISSLCSADDLLIVTADHGMVDVEADHRIDIDAIPELHHHVLNIGGEPRCRFIYTRPGHGEEVAANWRHHVGEYAWVMTRSQGIEAGYFGATDSTVGQRIGDVIVWAKDNWSFASSSIDSRVSKLRGQHGSLTPAELEIPLIRVPGGNGRG